MIEFKPAKNQEITACANGLLLHSAYNPTKEAERFAENLTITYEKTIIIIEPALSYCATFIKRKYPVARLGAIRFSKDFSNYNSEFDFILDLTDLGANAVSDKLLNYLGEEEVFSTKFVDWEPSKKAFADEYTVTINAIKDCMEKAKTLLVTREYFEKKWFLNTINFIKYVKHPVTLNGAITKDILIITSGPSLMDSLETIKKFQNCFFIIVLSSALAVCKKNNIRIDLCMTTDGGFWAGEHLKHIAKDTVLAVPAEAYVPKKLLNNNMILPLHYKDGLSKKILDMCNFTNSLEAERNGTVSGTAVKFALQNGKNNIFFTGLDMANAKGFQHSQPNELESNNSLTDFRTRTKESRMAKSEFSEGSMKIYLNWFQNEDFSKKEIYRVINNPKNSLGQIKDISSEEFLEKCNSIRLNNDACSKNIDKMFKKLDFNSNCLKELTENLDSLLDSEGIKALFPLTSLSLMHNPDSIELKERLENEKNRLYSKIKVICHE